MFIARIRLWRDFPSSFLAFNRREEFPESRKLLLFSDSFAMRRPRGRERVGGRLIKNESRNERWTEKIYILNRELGRKREEEGRTAPKRKRSWGRDRNENYILFIFHHIFPHFPPISSEWEEKRAPSSESGAREMEWNLFFLLLHDWRGSGSQQRWMEWRRGRELKYRKCAGENETFFFSTLLVSSRFLSRWERRKEVENLEKNDDDDVVILAEGVRGGEENSKYPKSKYYVSSISTKEDSRQQRAPWPNDEQREDTTNVQQQSEIALSRWDAHELFNYSHIVSWWFFWGFSLCLQ